jgi:uncharacterized repeat protein (TIGR02543 family)
MKKAIKLFGIAALVALIGFSMAACGDGAGGGGNDDTGGTPTGLSALVGWWYVKTSAIIPAFEITSGSKLILTDGTTFDISVSGNTVALKFGGTSVGTFDYAISNDEMIMMSGTVMGATIAALSPVVKLSSFTVTFNANGGTPTPQVQTVKRGGKVERPPNPTWEGYIFAGWRKNGDGIGTWWNFATDTVTEDITLYAMWEMLSIAVQPVFFDGITANGSSSQTTTQLALHFGQVMNGLSVNNIILSGVSGVIKGTLYGSGEIYIGSGVIYILEISGITSSGTLSVAVTAPSPSYEIIGSPKTVTIFYSSGAPPPLW